jgi:hypothetical protein
MAEDLLLLLQLHLSSLLPVILTLSTAEGNNARIGPRRRTSTCHGRLPLQLPPASSRLNEGIGFRGSPLRNNLQTFAPVISKSKLWRDPNPLILLLLPWALFSFAIFRPKIACQAPKSSNP